MPDDMFFTSDMKSLRRGKRVTARTPTCRPCLVWPIDAPDIKLQGVVLDVSPYGMLIRMLDSLPPDTEVAVQLMRDEAFREPLAAPVEGKVIRSASEPSGFTDHGVRLEQKEIKRAESKPIILPRRRPVRFARSRMHTLDITLGQTPRRRGK